MNRLILFQRKQNETLELIIEQSLRKLHLVSNQFLFADKHHPRIFNLIGNLRESLKILKECIICENDKSRFHKLLKRIKKTLNKLEIEYQNINNIDIMKK